ncbi:dihydrolipoamide acetyltransferase family protein [Parasphingopyxis lamellibrachiae]|uniref:Dihydrolipoamide acetyltransferase component of pyruvate dehydrogenase complex n=1 Tax=Parasphingopyxis lamellibrachiae TaxID=680125 RepID=A0A3D9FFE1_9SPHN|nr:dihydrolipoamide acetyltransferase family protein [Parasphingopyxis lamellibrachiae]RED16282.1 branched-chain alpha-keto acid dehydrogenase E2 component [Parasphingopyxis lamellibrachiae]
MATYKFKLPDIGEGIAEAEIVAWHVQVGDEVEEDQGIADVMTDKATVEMESPVTGKVVELNGEAGEMLAIGSVLAVIETDDIPDEDDVAPVVQKAAPEPAKEEPTEAASEPETVAPASTPAPQPVAEAAPAPSPSAPILASPAVRERARDLGVDLAQVQPHGDRIRHSDLDAYLSYGSGQGYRAPGRSRKREDEEIKVIGMRRRIAENMAASKRNIPHFTYVEEMDVTELEDMRNDLNGSRGDRPKLTVLPFIIAAICKTLPDFPMLNATYDDEGGTVTRHGAVHLGMATQTDAGLTVPVIRNAQDMNVWQLSLEIARLSEAARTGKIKSEELSGGTLTLTSLGPLGGIATTPVINRPQVAIIGPNKIVERPAIIDGELEARKQMNISISCDHRVVDGYDAASYVQALKKLIETPVLIFTD